MTWAFDVTSNIPRIKQTGTDTNLSGIATAIAAVPTVARSTAYAVTQMVKPPAANGMWYRCSTAGTTSGTAPLYNPVSGGTITDGTAVFTAFLAPDVRTLGTTNHYYMPDFRFSVEGTLTNSNPQQETFTCWDLLLPAMASNFTSGAWATDGVTPRWDGLHFCATRVGSNNADNGSGGLQLQNGQFTFIGGEVQVAGAIGFTAGTTPRSYQTRWRNTKEWGASSSRIRSYTNLAIFRDCEFFDIAYDLFRMPAEFSVKARGSEYLAQYVGGQAGGADAKFTASNLENVDGTYDFDNYFSGWVELYNCKAGAALKVVSQYPNSTFWARHCVPLYQDIVITAKNTAGAAVQDVRFTATESPTNSPTVTISTVSNLKTWDFRSPLSYQTTTNASGVATSSPVLNVWYWESSFKQSLRWPLGAADVNGKQWPTAAYEGRAYGYKSTTVPVELGASAAIQVSAGMIARDTATVLTRAAALAQTGFTFIPSGATGGTVTSTGAKNLRQLWDYYNAWIIEYGNRSSQDTWTCIAGTLSMGGWSLDIPSGSSLLADPEIDGLITTGSVTNAGTINFPYQDVSGQRISVTGTDPMGFGITWFLRHKPTSGSTWTNLSGTGNTSLILLTPGAYDVQVRAPGYDWKLTTLDTNVSLSLDLALNHHISSANTPQYTMAYSASLEAIFSYDATALSVAVGNTTGAILNPGFAELYQATQRIQHLPALVWTWTAPVTANASTQKIIIPSGNPITMFLTSASTASVKMTCPVIHDTGVSADDRVKGNASGFSIILGSPATAESAGLAAQIIGSLGGPSFVSEDHGLSVIKDVQDLVKTAVDAIQDKTDNLPADPAAAGDAMTLTLDYESAKHAASQASVDQLAFDALTLEQVEDSAVLAKEASIRKLSIKVGNLE